MLEMLLRDYACRQAYWKLACTLLAIACISSFVSPAPSLPFESLDPSWHLGVSHGVEQGLRIGTDLIFTIGPLSNVYTEVYSKTFDSVYLAYSCYIAMAIYIGIYGIFAAHKKATPVLLCALVIMILGAYKDALFMLAPVLTSLCLISRSPHSNKISQGRLFLVALCIPVLGLLPLIKLNASALCIFCMLMNVAFALHGRHYFWAVLYCILPVASLCAAWISCGQSLSDIPAYIINAQYIISGYTEAMALQNSIALPLLFLAGSGVLGVGLLLFASVSKHLRLAILMLVVAYLFVAFKAGFVREDDGHTTLSGIALLMISLLSWPFIHSFKGLGSVCAGCLAGMVVIGANKYIVPATIPGDVYRKIVNSYNGLKVRILSPERYAIDVKNRMEQIASTSGFPRLEGSTDVYSAGQVALISSGAEWKPRPIFQSYSAYTPELIEKNARHLQGAGGAKNIVFAVEPIDGRLPSLEDGESWPIIYSQYTLSGFSGKYAVLKRNNDLPTTPSLLEQRVVKLGERFAIPEFEGQTYMTAEINPSFFGRVRAAIFKPVQLKVRLVLGNGQTREYRVVSGMTKTQFLISPLVETTSEFADLFGGHELLTSKKVVLAEFFSTTPNDESWSDHVELKFFGLKANVDESASKILGVTMLEPATNISERTCVGWIDSLNGTAPKPEIIKPHGYLQLAGWNSITTDGFPKGVENVVLLSSGSQTLAGNAKPFDRPDLEEHFNAPSMAKSGFSTIIDVRGLSGRFKLGLGIKENGEIAKCPQYSYDIEL